MARTAPWRSRLGNAAMIPRDLLLSRAVLPLSVGAGNPRGRQRVRNDRQRIELFVLGGIRLEGRQELTERAGRTGAGRTARIGAGGGVGAGTGGRTVVPMMMVMATAAADRLRQVRHVGELTACRSVGKVRRQRVELRRRRRIAIRCRGAGGALQVGGDLLGDLLVLRRVRLLQLLQRAHQLRER